MSPSSPSFSTPLNLFVQSLRAVSPSSTAFTPNRPLTPLSTAFTQTHRSVGYPRAYLRQSPVTIHDFVSSVSPSLHSLRLCGKSRIFILLRTLHLSCRSFFALPSFVFNRLRTLRQKTPGWGCATQSAPLPNVTRRPVDNNSSLDFNPGRGLLRYRSLTVICQLSQFLSLVAAVPSN